MKMKTNYNFLMASMMLFTLLAAGCGGDDTTTPTPDPDPVFAGFEFSVANDSVVTFTNKSTGAETYLWDFGDGTNSTEANPIHTYTIGATEAAFTVLLTATGEGGEDEESKVITLTRSLDPNSAIFQLTGGETKTWKLAPMPNAVNFGPMATEDGSNPENVIWWGNNEEAVTNRPCLFDNTYTFVLESKEMVRDINGSLWKEWKVFDAEGGEGCLPEGDEAISRLEHNVDAWKDGDYSFAISNGDSTKLLTISGAGGYVGHYTAGTGTSYMPDDEYVYSIESISSDTLKLQGFGWGGDSDGIEGYEQGKPDRLVRVTLVPVE